MLAGIDRYAGISYAESGFHLETPEPVPDRCQTIAEQALSFLALISKRSNRFD
jgi:hypothetical protein